jgi:GGDEF domain-containing protein
VSQGLLSLRQALLGLGFLCCTLLHSWVQAAPQVYWSEQVRIANEPGQHQAISLDLRNVWEATRVGQVTLANDKFFDPDLVWNWSGDRFAKASSRADYSLKSGERFVARLTLFSEEVGTDLNLSAVLPRLDAMHVSYRYDGGPWTTLSAGDTLAMNRWMVPDRQPTFDLPQTRGQMDLVVQLAHRGIAFAPMLIQNDRSQVADLTFNAWTVGMMVGIQLIMALMGVLFALNFRRSVFLSATLMSLLTVMLITFGGGFGGLYMGTLSDSFNDEIKFFFSTVWCLALPFVAATTLGLVQRSRGWLYFTTAWMVLGAALTWVWMDYTWRDTTAAGIPALLLCTLLLTGVIILWTSLRYMSLQIVVLSGLLVYAVALLMPFAGFLGLISNASSAMAAASLMLMSSFLLIHGMYARHRMGRQVMARANISPLRDVLTGLLNRDGLQAHLYNTVRSRVQNEQTAAIFIYINVLDSELAMQEYGEQGFDMGMVQIAASLATSVSGVDSVARISHHAFAISVLMPPDPALATRLAQKILSRIMALATHGAALAGTARMALAWQPLFGFRLDALERRCVRTLEELEPIKRIGWVGGSESHSEAAQMLRDSRLAYSTPSDMAPLEPQAKTTPKDGASSNLYDRIHRIEREMLHGMDTRFLVADAQRASQALNEAYAHQASQATTQSPAGHASTAQDDYPPTELLPSPLRP